MKQRLLQRLSHFVLTAMVVWVPPTAAAESGDSAEPIAYAEALRRALGKNPELASVEAGVVSARGTLVSARGAFDPTLSSSSGYSASQSQSIQEYGQVDSTYAGLNSSASITQFSPTGTTATLSMDVSQSRFRYELAESNFVVESDAQFDTKVRAQVSQALLEGHKLAHNLEGVRAAKAAVTESELSLQSARLETVASAASAYWELHYQEATVRIAREALRIAEEELRIATAQVEAGELAPVERTRAEAAMIESQSNLFFAETGCSSASDALSVVLGERPSSQWTASSDPAAPVPVALDEAAIVSAALEQSPTLGSARLGVENAKADWVNRRHGLLPQLDATASYTMEGYETSLSSAFSEMTGGALAQWYLGAEFSMPLGNRSDRGQLLAAKAALSQYENALRSAENTLVQQVRAQVRSVDGAHQQVELARKNVELAELTLSAEKARQSQGRAIERDVLDAQKTMSEARVALAKARTDYALSKVELGRLRGKIDSVAD
jgi:outer membrane protein TolC